MAKWGPEDYAKLAAQQNAFIQPGSEEYLRAYAGGNRALANARGEGATNAQLLPYAQQGQLESQQAIASGAGSMADYLNMGMSPQEAQARIMQQAQDQTNQFYQQNYGVDYQTALQNPQAHGQAGLINKAMGAPMASPFNYGPARTSLPKAQGFGPGTSIGLADPLTGEMTRMDPNAQYTGAVSPWTGQSMPLHSKMYQSVYGGPLPAGFGTRDDLIAGSHVIGSGEGNKKYSTGMTPPPITGIGGMTPPPSGPPVVPPPVIPPPPGMPPGTQPPPGYAPPPVMGPPSAPPPSTK